MLLAKKSTQNTVVTRVRFRSTTSQGGTHVVERNLTRVTTVFCVLFFANSIALFHYLG